MWCPTTQTLFWADIFECTVYALGAERRVRTASIESHDPDELQRGAGHVFVVDGLGVLGQAPLRFGAGRPVPVGKVVAGG